MFDTLEVTETTSGQSATVQAATMMAARSIFKEEVLKTVANMQLQAADGTLATITSRFSTALPLSRLADAHIVVIGVGGIGSHVVKNLVAMGARNLTVIDDDVVEAQNVGTQFHRLTDIGLPKVQSMYDEMIERYGVGINTIQARVTDLPHVYTLVNNTPIDILIGAVDNMELRNEIGGFLENILYGYAKYGDTSNELVRAPKFYIDSRMSLGLWNVFSLPIANMVKLAEEQTNGDGGEVVLYKALEDFKEIALFVAEEGMQEPCTARALGYTGENIASYLAALVDYYLRELHRYDKDITRSFLSTTTSRTEKVPFKWIESYDARNFSNVSLDPFKEKLKADKQALMQENIQLTSNTTALLQALKKHQIVAEYPPDTIGYAFWEEHTISEGCTLWVTYGTTDLKQHVVTEVRYLVNSIALDNDIIWVFDTATKQLRVPDGVTIWFVEPGFKAISNVESTHKEEEKEEEKPYINKWKGVELPIGSTVAYKGHGPAIITNTLPGKMVVHLTRTDTVVSLHTKEEVDAVITGISYIAGSD